MPTECGKSIKALVLCKERFQETECQHGSVVFILSSAGLSLHLSSLLASQSTVSMSIYITDVGWGSCLGQRTTWIHLDTQNG